MALYFLTITLNNFLIAKVSSSYEDFLVTAEFSKYFNKIYIVREFLMYQNFFSGSCHSSKMENFDLVIMFQREDQT